MAINLNERSIGPVTPGTKSPAEQAKKTNVLLESILNELKILNKYNSLSHDDEITKEDL